jgi:hypothetical protein
MSRIRYNIYSAIQYGSALEIEFEMDEHLKKSAEKVRKSKLQYEISRLASMPNFSETILQNQVNGILYTQTILKNVSESAEIHKKLNQNTDPNETQQTQQEQQTQEQQTI